LAIVETSSSRSAGGCARVKGRGNRSTCRIRRNIVASVRRLAVPAVAVAAALLLGLAGARAATINGTARADVLRGTALADAIDGRGGADRIDGRSGRDRLVGGRGDDRISAQEDAARDSIRCGAGLDVVLAELDDVVAADCETVSRQLSRDLLTDFESQHRTQVEPDSLSFGATIVTAFQSGRMVDGGAAGIGFATSTDAGASWHAGAVPQGARETTSDPVVAYDAVHRTWLLATVGVDGRQMELLVSRSRDGLAWGAPVVAGGDEDYDKEWVACDNWGTSPHRGRCYLSYLDVRSDELRTRSSDDGGLTWSAPALTAGRSELGLANGAQPLVRPDGTVVVAYSLFAAFSHFADATANQIRAVRSTDGGRTFEPPVRVAQLDDEEVRAMRAPALPSADVDAAGNLFVVWSDCRFRPECSANDLVVARSTDGRSWAAPERVPAVPPDSDVQVFVPGLAVAPGSAGSTARLALVYYTLPESCAFEGCRGLGVGLIRSADGGRSWGRPLRLDAEPMGLDWIAVTGTGRMLGDYISASYAGGRPIPVFALASQPVGETFRQSIYAATRLGR
jgi:hypothetical protein